MAYLFLFSFIMCTLVIFSSYFRKNMIDKENENFFNSTKATQEYDGSKKIKHITNEELFAMYDISQEDFANDNPIIDVLTGKCKKNFKGEESNNIKDFKLGLPGKCLDNQEYEIFLNDTHKKTNEMVRNGIISEREKSFVEEMIRNNNISQVAKKKVIDNIKTKMPNEWHYFSNVLQMSNNIAHYLILNGAPFPNETSDYTPFVFNTVKSYFLYDKTDDEFLDREYFETLLNNGIDVNLRNFEGLNLISYYIENVISSSSFSIGVTHNTFIDDIKYLYEKGVAIDIAEKLKIQKAIHEMKIVGGEVDELMDIIVSSDKDLLQNELRISVNSDEVDIRATKKSKKRKI